jgi:hypothetical protein
MNLFGLFGGLSLLARIFTIVGLVATAGTAYGVWHYKVYSKGYAAAEAVCQQRIAKAAADFEQARIDRDKEVDTTIGAVVAEQTQALQSQAKELEQKVKDYESLLAKRPANAACILGPDDLGLRKQR